MVSKVTGAGLIDSLLSCRSIAVVGATTSNGVARNLVSWNRAMSTGVNLHPVHPRNRTFLGLSVVPSIEDVDEKVDVLAVALGPEAARSIIEESAPLGIPFAIAYSDLRSAFASVDLMNEWFADLSHGGTSVIGPNCMGLASMQRRVALYSGEVNSFALPGGDVGLVCQSGAIMIALLAAAPRLRFSHVFSSGNESMIGLAHYVQFLAQDPQTKCIGLFLEAIRDPAGFDQAMEAAHAHDVPVVALCVGKAPGARENVATHSGALAPEQRMMSAYLSDRGVLEVSSLQELTETLIAMRSPRRPQGGRAGMVHLSGGEASLQIDLAWAGPLSFPALSQTVRSHLTDRAPWLSGSDNPMDAWGPPSFAENYRHCLSALGSDSQIDFVLVNQHVAQHLCDPGPVVGSEVAKAVVEFTEQSTKPVVMISTASLGIDYSVHALLESSGVALLTGDAAGVGAVANCVRYEALKGVARSRLRHRLPRGGVKEFAVPDLGTRLALSEHESARLLANAGLRRPRTALVRTMDEAHEAVDDIGYPVVLKASIASVTHKSDLGAVITGIADKQELERAFRSIQENLGDQECEAFLVVEQVHRHREILLGVHRDPTFGLMMVVGFGGILAEIVDDVVVACPPVSVEEATGLIHRLRCRKWLDAWRHLRAADVKALAHMIATFSGWAVESESWLDSAELNPVAVLEDGEGCVFLDALIVQRQVESQQGERHVPGD